jgi:3-(3-hydroxy-phenyl)propionate hydroxylase
MSSMPRVPVIIVGAGPVGLCTALWLSRRGVECLILEREAAPPRDLRASTFHPPTLDLLAELGLTAEILRRGLIAPTWQTRLHETHERAVFDLGLLARDTDHPYRVQFEQAEFVTLALGAVSAAPGVTLRARAEVGGLLQDQAGVTLLLGQGRDRERIAAHYVVAADGAGSTLRRLLGLPFEGLTYPETTVLATTTFPFENHLPGLSPINYVWTRDSNYALLRLPDRWRVSLYPDPDEDPETEPWRLDDPARLEAKLQRIVPRTAPYELLEHRPYRIHQRIVPTYRVGRVLLAGDAAHVNSPTGGMGMNCGIHDAWNLAGKLAAVVGGASEDLLDLYDRQRRPIAAEEILKQADRNRSRMRNTDPAFRRQELARLQSIAADAAAAREYLLASSMIAGLRRSAAIA